MRRKAQDWLDHDGLLLIEGWARDGLTIDQIAHNMGINDSTLYAWKSKHKELDDALKRGKDVVDREVENALYKRAMGYKYTETTVIIDSKGQQSVKTVDKEVPPDVTAQIFWLKNRKPGEWRDKRDVEMSGVTAVQIIDDISDINAEAGEDDG